MQQEPNKQLARIKRTYLPVTNQITVANLRMTSQDIASWKQAIDSARNATNPRRKLLYDLYESIMLDGQLLTVTNKRKTRITNKRARFVTAGQEGVEDEFVREFITETPWFQRMIGHAIEAVWWGHSLIELIPENGLITEAVLIPRHNVIPEREFLAWDYMNDTDGIYYQEDPLYSKYLVSIGGKKDYGLLMSAAQYIIYKRGGFGDWAQFTELFGMPFREGRYNPYDSDSRRLVEQALQESGGAGWITLPEGASITFHDNNGTGKSEVFKDLIHLCDEQISKLILGQTMTTDAGSSRSQSETHQDTEDEIVMSDMLAVEYLLNWGLRDKLIKIGYKIPEGRFHYPQLENIPLQTRIDMDIKLSSKIAIDEQYWYETYGIPKPENGILTPKPQPVPEIENTEEEEEEPDVPNKGKPDKHAKAGKPDKGGKPTALAPKISCCGISPEVVAEVELSEEEIALVKNVWNAKQGPYDAATYQQAINKLKEALFTHISPKSEYDTPDYVTGTLMEANINQFGFDKNVETVLRLNQALGESNDFDAFEQKAMSILGQINRAQLKTEYNFAVAVAQNASAWNRQKRMAEVFPYLQYQTIGDSRVRAAHQALDGKVFAVADADSWQGIYPPNGWGCRCEMIQLMEHQAKPEDLTTGGEAIGLLDEEWDAMVKGGFNTNRGEMGEIFNLNNAYLKKIPGNKKPDMNALSYEDAELFSRDEMKKKGTLPLNSLPKHPLSADEIAAERQRIKAAHKNNKPVTWSDYTGRPISIMERDFVSHTTKAKYLSEKEERQNLYRNIPDILSDPHEVYFKHIKGKYNWVYVRHYGDDSMVVVTEIDRYNKNPEGLVVRTWYKLDVNQEKLNRSGVLIKGKGTETTI